MGHLPVLSTSALTPYGGILPVYWWLGSLVTGCYHLSNPSCSIAAHSILRPIGHWADQLKYLRANPPRSDTRKANHPTPMLILTVSCSQSLWRTTCRLGTSHAWLTPTDSSGSISRSSEEYCRFFHPPPGRATQAWSDTLINLTGYGEVTCRRPLSVKHLEGSNHWSSDL